MISSMTGYGKSVIEKDSIIAEVEVKSLNSRFLDISVHLPKALFSRELEIKGLIRKLIHRGKITVFATTNNENSKSNSCLIDEDGVKRAVELVEKIKSTAKIDEDTTLAELINFQDMFLIEKTSDEENQFELISAALLDALNKLVEMRRREGNELKNDLLNRLNKIDNLLNEIETNFSNEINQYFEKLKQRAKQLYSEFIEDQNRLNSELALLVDRYDITEECVRLRSHIKMFKDTMENSGEIGKKLNFISQEINREANTINSKSISTIISHSGILIKEELEKIREQIQNIE